MMPLFCSLFHREKEILVDVRPLLIYPERNAALFGFKMSLTATTERIGIGWFNYSYGRKHSGSGHLLFFEANKTAPDKVRFFLIQVNID